MEDTARVQSVLKQDTVHSKTIDRIFEKSDVKYLIFLPPKTTHSKLRIFWMLGRFF
jgi:hypothetical protein